MGGFHNHINAFYVSIDKNCKVNIKILNSLLMLSLVGSCIPESNNVMTRSDTKPTFWALHRDSESADWGTALLGGELEFCWLKITHWSSVFFFSLETTVWDEGPLCVFAEQLVTAWLQFAGDGNQTICFINLNVSFLSVHTYLDHCVFMFGSVLTAGWNMEECV